jgi:hypothetical protein
VRGSGRRRGRRQARQSGCPACASRSARADPARRSARPAAPGTPAKHAPRVSAVSATQRSEATGFALRLRFVRALRACGARALLVPPHMRMSALRSTGARSLRRRAHAAASARFRKCASRLVKPAEPPSSSLDALGTHSPQAMSRQTAGRTSAAAPEVPMRAAASRCSSSARATARADTPRRADSVFTSMMQHGAAARSGACEASPCFFEQEN